MRDDNGIEWLAEGSAFAVGVTRRVARVFDKLDARIRGSLRAWMETYAKEGGNNIPKERFRFEAHITVGREGMKFGIFAFKEWQTRLYGGVVPGANRPTFLVTEIDTAKKQNKADRACIERAAKYLAEFVPPRNR